MKEGSMSNVSNALPPWIEKFIDKTIQMLQNDILKKKIQILILEPFLQYIIELIFPYVIIICAIFGIMFFMMISIIGILVFRSAPSAAAAASLVS